MIRKSITYFFLTLLLGSIILALISMTLAGNPEWETIPITGGVILGSFFISFLFALPLLIPILIFYGILHFTKPDPKLYYILNVALGPVLTSIWIFAVSTFVKEKPLYFVQYWIAYGLGSAIAGFLVTYFDLKSYLQPLFKDPRKLY